MKASVKLERKDFISEKQPLWQQLHHSASVTTGDGNIFVLDLLKLSLLSPFIKGVLDTFSVPSSLSYLLDVNIILPDFSPDTLAVLVEVLEGTAVRAGDAVISQVKSLVNVLGLRVGLLKDGEKINSVKSVLPRLKAKTAECKPESISQHKENRTDVKIKSSKDGVNNILSRVKSLADEESRTVRYANAPQEPKKCKKGLKSKSVVKNKNLNRIKRRVNEERSRRDKINSLTRLHSGGGRGEKRRDEGKGWVAREYRLVREVDAERTEVDPTREHVFAHYENKRTESQRFNCYDVGARQCEPEMEFCGDNMNEYPEMDYCGDLPYGLSFGGEIFDQVGVGGARNNSFGREMNFQDEYCQKFREAYVPRRENLGVDSSNYYSFQNR